MTNSTMSAFAALTLATTLSTGCDSEAAESAQDYRTAAHIDLATAVATPWVKAALKDQAFNIEGEFGPCLAVFKAAQSVTLGSGELGYEVYFTGPMDSDAADGCAEFLEKAAKKSKKKGSDDPEGVLLDGDLFAVHSHKVSPSRARMETLLSADPSPSGSNPMWVVAQPNTKGSKAPVEFVQAWADTTKGLTLHADVQFQDTAMATDVYGKGMLGLAAMRMSGETEELARAVKLGSKGKTITADVTLPAATLTKLIKAKRASAKIERKADAKDSGGSLSISIDASK